MKNTPDSGAPIFSSPAFDPVSEFPGYPDFMITKSYFTTAMLILTPAFQSSDSKPQHHPTKAHKMEPE